MLNLRWNDEKIVWVSNKQVIAANEKRIKMYNLEEARNKVLDDTGEKKRVKIRKVMSAT